ncbi:unnamed protein product [Mytilus coruscus]|uniref:Peptidase C76 domain-containing protein n=1 Tax=Mytilus coruscus TaxID=42192 RepID=A0A6J8DEE5_MYTCO|nr:unnamed protein product [Mytilus coruscus]
MFPCLAGFSQRQRKVKVQAIRFSRRLSSVQSRSIAQIEEQQSNNMVLNLHANIHQGCHIFHPFSGMKCTAIALIALLTFMHHMPNLSNLTPDNLDQTFIEGTDLYAFIRGQGRGDGNGFLSHRDLPSRLGDWDNRFNDVQYFFDRYYGPVNSDVALNYDAGQLYFQDVILDSLQTSSFMLMTFFDNTIAVFHDDLHNVIYLFDSHQRNALGFPDPHGRAVLLRFETFDEFYAYIFTAYRNNKAELFIEKDYFVIFGLQPELCHVRGFGEEGSQRRG